MNADNRSMQEQPFVSVVIRSMNRLYALKELVQKLSVQDYPTSRFEIIIVDQSNLATVADRKIIRNIRQIQNVVLLRFEPLGGPEARNVGVRNANGDIIILIDDDDLPATHTWISDHVKHYEDPRIMGVTARHVRFPNERDPYIDAIRPFYEWRCMGYSLLKTSYTYARLSTDINNVEWLHGTNASLRSSLFERVGEWDAHVQTQDEHSFAFKAHNVLKDDEMLVFRKQPEAIRRVDIEGGMDKRNVDVKDEFLNQLSYVNLVVGKYFPKRRKWLAPVYSAWVWLKVMIWVWNRSRQPCLSQRIKDSIKSPKAYIQAKRECPTLNQLDEQPVS
jgi:glycosyltransferase involved in cell wall biosynthesis